MSCVPLVIGKGNFFFKYALKISVLHKTEQGPTGLSLLTSTVVRGKLILR